MNCPEVFLLPLDLTTFSIDWLLLCELFGGALPLHFFLILGKNDLRVRDTLEGVFETVWLIMGHGLVLAEKEHECECGPLTLLGTANDVSAELLDDELAYMQPQADAFWVLLLRVFEESEQFEQLLLVLFRNADATVNYLDLQGSVFGIL